MNKLGIVLCSLLMVSGQSWAQMKVVAHRGYWNSRNAAQNSVAALRNASKAGVWGSEFDVHITKDGVVVVNHDDDIHGVIIEDALYEDIRKMRLANGETLPTLSRYLEEGRRMEGMRLVLEIKEHATTEREDSCVAACLREVRLAKMADHVDYISFSLHACERILQAEPQARVYYLNGELPPDIVKRKGMAGIDYSGGVIAKHPQWVKECHDLGLKVNVWTIDEVKKIRYFRQLGVDYVTTNKPAEALEIASGKL